MAKLCKLSDKKYHKKVVSEAPYECKKCGRVGTKKDKICKPQKN